MTCIAGVVHKGQVWLASDGQATWGWSKFDVGSKVVQVDDLAIAITGYSAVSVAIQNRMQLPEVPEDESKHDRWLCVQVPDAIRRCLKEAGILANEDGRIDAGCSAIIGWRGRLCTMDSLLACSPEVRPYTALGSGGDVALGSLFSTEGKTPKSRLETAINAANMWAVGCGCDVHVVKVGE